MPRVLTALVITLLAGCTSSGAFGALEGEQQARFARCWANVGGRFCGPLSLAHTDCRNGYQASFADTAPPDRGRYLGELGCAADEPVAVSIPACPAAAPCPEASCPACAECPACTSGGEAGEDAAPVDAPPTEANEAIDET